MVAQIDSPSAQTVTDFSAIADALRRRQPEAVKVLQQKYPGLQSVLAQKRILGAPAGADTRERSISPKAPARYAGGGAPAAAAPAAAAPAPAPREAVGLLELAEMSSEEAHSDLDEVLQRVTARARTLAQLRMVSGVVSAITTGGLIALLMGTNRTAQVGAAVIGFLSSILALVSSYLEDFSGGDGSTRRLRESLVEQVRQLADARSRIRVARATANEGDVMGILQVINGILGEAQRARAMMGLPI